MSLIVSAESAAEYITKTFWNWKTPVNTKELALKMGIEITELSESSIARGDSIACFTNFAGKKVIAYNPTETEEEIRFSIGHGIGHWCMGHTGFNNHHVCNKNSGCFSDHPSDNHEFQANEFAKLVLLPEQAIHYFTVSKGMSDISELSREMGVSEVLLHTRLKELGDLNV